VRRTGSGLEGFHYWSEAQNGIEMTDIGQADNNGVDPGLGQPA
jgi:hypothetical protein